MKKKLMVNMCFLLLGVPALSFAEAEKILHPSVFVYPYANESAILKHNKDMYNFMVNKKVWAKWLAEKEAERAKIKEQEVKDEEEGQITVKF